MEQNIRKITFAISILFALIGKQNVYAQNSPELVLPKGSKGTVELKIPAHSIVKPEAEYLAIFVKNSTDEYSSNAIQGTYKIDRGYLVFTPYFPFEDGMDYVVRTKSLDSDSIYYFQSFQVGKKKMTEEAEVLNIYPTARKLPENILRFYIYFKTPMKKGEALKHIHLVDSKGSVDHLAFMEFKQELWSADGKRLTLLFDPGRIKRGVSTNLKHGPALLQGEQYTLRVSSSWQDVYGQPLMSNHEKVIQVIKGYREQIKVDDWVLIRPASNSYDSLNIGFDRIMDHALLKSMLKMVDATGNIIAGKWEVSEQATSVQFLPEQPWKEGHYQIIVDSRLEDIAGNNLQNLLDFDNKKGENNSRQYYSIQFEI